MIVIPYVAFTVLGLVCGVITYKRWKATTLQTVINNPNFKLFQRKFFPAYFLALLADWLQGPYLYALYSQYGFEQSQIAVLYICGYASSVFLGIWASSIANYYGRRNLCVVFTVFYTISCAMKLSGSYGLLLLGRFFGGMATSLLFTSFEAWYIHEHTVTYDFPREWIRETMETISLWNGVLACISGLLAQLTADWLVFGPVSPSILAVPVLIVSGVFVFTTWNENYGTQEVTAKSTCLIGLREIGESRKVLLLGTTQSLFESVLAIMVFIWTPFLGYEYRHSLGIVFSCFMICSLFGTVAYNLVAEKVEGCFLLVTSVSIALISCSLCAVIASAQPFSPESEPSQPWHKYATLLVFLFYEAAVGLYFATMTKLRAEIVPEIHSSSIMTWFRVPLNIISCIVLMLLHDESFRHGNRLIFIVCSVLLFCAVVSSLMLLKIRRKQSGQKELFGEFINS